MALMRLSLAVLAALVVVSPATAGWTCGGGLTAAQEAGFQSFFSPPFTPALSHMGGPIAEGNFSKVVNAQRLKELSVDTPRVAVSKKLDETNAKVLAKWLNDDASASIPGWFATAIGIFVPVAWIGISADVASQLINNSGDAGRQKLANIAGTVSAGGYVAVLERIAKDKTGNNKYFWNYVYQAKLNDKEINFLLYSCIADVVVK